MRLRLLVAIRRQGTQREFARKHGFTESRLSSIIRGYQEPRADERRKLTAALGRSSKLLELSDKVA